MKQDTITGKNHGDNYCYYYLHQNGDLIHKTKHFDKNLKKGSSRKRVFDGVSNEIKKISQGMALSVAADHLPGLKAMSNYTTKNNIDMKQETFNKAEFNRKCKSSIEKVRAKLFKDGKKIICESITINVKGGNNITLPGNDPFPFKDENDPIYTGRFKDRMDFVGQALVEMMILACDDEIETLEENFTNIKDQEVKDGKSEN